MAAAAALASAKLEVFHQSGPADRDRVAQAYERAGVRAEVVAFETDMPRRYRWADVALCRAGALSIAELTLAGLPAVLVPLPHAADDEFRPVLVWQLRIEDRGPPGDQFPPVRMTQKCIG